jgi:antitoxin CptB
MPEKAGDTGAGQFLEQFPEPRPNTGQAGHRRKERVKDLRAQGNPGSAEAENGAILCAKRKRRKGIDMEELERQRKKLMFQCHHRGTKELDLVLGPFADAHLADLDADELRVLTAFLSEIDPDIYDWLSGREPLPARLQSAVTERLVAFGRLRLSGEGA